MRNLSVKIRRRGVRALLRAPAAVLRAIAGPARSSPEGYTLDLQTQTLVRLYTATQSVTWTDMSVARARRDMEDMAGLLSPEPSQGVAVRDRRIPVGGATIVTRFYFPESARGRPAPVVVYYHGGGFVLGSLATHDAECRALALAVPAIVVAIDYRRAPEHPFPAAVDDGLAAFRWVAQNAAAFGGDVDRIAVAGDSAGGNIAAVVARDTRGDAVKPSFQLLIYPATDCTRSLASHAKFNEGLLLTAAAIDWFILHYMGDRDLTDPRASPLLADGVAGAPPAMVLTAGFDSLRDEGHAYAEKLASAGIPVDTRCYEGLVHGFFSMSSGVDAAHGAFDDAVGGLRAALYPSA